MLTREINESSLKLIIVDYPKLLLDNPTAYSIFGNMIQSRQKNFLSTSESFLVIDKHDLIGTHVFIYDFSNPFSGKLVAGVRITYEQRAREHSVTMPIESMLDLCPPAARDHYDQFRAEKGPSIQLNTLFVAPEYSLSKSGLRLSEVLFFGLCSYIRRLGQDHFLTVPNNQLKTDRWVKLSGNWSRPTFTFNHPDVNAEHTLYFIDSINEEWLSKCVHQFEHYWRTSFEIIPNQIKPLGFEKFRESLGQKVKDKVIPFKRTS